MKAVVTGAGRGIGRAIADAFLDEGYEVVVVDTKFDDEPPENELLHRVVGDVADPDVHLHVATVGERTLTAWVNNAGIALSAPLHELERADFERLMAVNLGGVVWGARAALSAMLSAGTGSIVNISSTQAHLGFDDYPAYAAAKGGIEALTRQVASQYAAQGVRCNAVAPGVIETPLNARILSEAQDPEALSRSWHALCPVGRLGTAADVASAVTWLCNPAQSFITGQVIVIDGGQTIRPLSMLS